MEKAPHFAQGPLPPVLKIFGVYFLTNRANFFTLSRNWQCYSLMIAVVLIIVNFYLVPYLPLYTEGIHDAAFMFAIVHMFGFGIFNIFFILWILFQGQIFCSAVNEIIRIKKEIVLMDLPIFYNYNFFNNLLINFVLQHLFGFVCIFRYLFSEYQFLAEMFALLSVVYGVVSCMDTTYLIYLYNLNLLFECINLGTSRIRKILSNDFFLRAKNKNFKKSRSKTLKYLESLRLIHFDACEVALNINDCFATVNIVNISLDFISIVYIIYGHGRFPISFLFDGFNTLFWTVYFSRQIWIKAVSSFTTRDEVIIK